MYPEDRVLVGVMTHPRDLELARREHWYRVPKRHAPKGIHAEYVAFYFTKAFDESLRWAIHFYARRTGHELVRRRDLLPGEPDHPRADEPYYKLQLGPIRQKRPPIVSLRWRRITFIHTTWDRFVAAQEINDLLSSDEVFVDRVYHALRERGVKPEREVEVQDGERVYKVDLLIPCHDGAVMAVSRPERPGQAIRLAGDVRADVMAITTAIERWGGPLAVDLPLDL
jgi:hypothetical protein